ncbi:hypothetical protein C8F04DRAFT_1098212 [Mycena alexandri]|uniref:Uncharacterized protein n=1 Tax=Mycena alexandri TaxID=1745969 RepID=A0AAD6SYC5_9AGAR|nr:hypothetical protein C8F04DRAFT_1098212 [Mycena alexandri]
MAFTEVPLNTLVVGDIIYCDVRIDKKDMADPNSKSTTARKINNGQPVTRLAVVLVAGATSVRVTYLATFAGATALPASFADKSYWYPFTPATKESTYDPLPARADSPVAQWASLRATQTVTQTPVKRVDGGNIGTASADLIRAAMKA